MPHHIYNQITEGLPACGEVFGDFYTVVPTYKILRAVLCLYDLPCPGCKSIAFAFCHPVSSIFSFQGTMVGLRLQESHSQKSLMFASLTQAILVGLRGLEPPTLRLSGVRSNHLSYKPIVTLGVGLR